MNIINSGTASTDTFEIFDLYESGYTFDLEDLDTIGVFDPELFVSVEFLLTESSELMLTESGEEIKY